MSARESVSDQQERVPHDPPAPGPDDPLPKPSALWSALGRGYIRAHNTLLALGQRLLFPRRPSRPARVGIWRVGQIGDLLSALPALAAIRAAHPDAHLVLLSSPGPASAPGARELYAAGSPVNALFTWHQAEIKRAAGKRQLIRRIKALRLERVYMLSQELTRPATEWRNLLALWFAGARGVSGTCINNAHGLPPKIARAHDRQTRWRPEAERLLRSTGLAPVPFVGSLDLTAEEHGAAAKALEPGANAAPLLVLAPGSKLASKRWPAERFGEIGRRWTERGGQVAVIGSAAEGDLGERVAGWAGPQSTNLCGRLDLRSSAALLGRAAALLSNDSGPAHLAAAVGCPTVALFAGTDRVGLWHPLGASLSVLRAEVACAPCYQERCPHANACLTRLDLAQVEGELWTTARRVPDGTKIAESVEQTPAALPRRGREPQPERAMRPKSADESR